MIQRKTALSQYMQDAVDCVQSSPHGTNKVAASLVGADFQVTKTNFWPQSLLDAFGMNTKIGDASATIHAETACILGAPAATQGAMIFITDPPCPNCMKNIAEAGIDAIYIDHKGFTKDFAQRRGHHFSNMSMRIAEEAGLKVYEIWRKEQRIQRIDKTPVTYAPYNEKPVQISTAPLSNGTQNHAYCQAIDSRGNVQFINARPHMAIGLSQDSEIEPQGKYSFTLQPLNRVMMNAARLGLSPIPHSFYSHHCPTARELVNFVGAGYRTLHITHKDKARDKHGLMALDQLVKAGILDIQN